MKTAIGSDPKPSPDELIKSIEQMNWIQLLILKGKLDALIQKRREKNIKERYEKYE